MAKGIRNAVNNKFFELSHKRIAGEFGDINGTLAEGNRVFRREVMQFAVDTFGININSAAAAYNHAFKWTNSIAAELVAGLGRADDKKGGRKPTVEDMQAEQAVVEVKTYTVSRKRDGAVQAVNLTLEAAQAMVDKAFNSKKATLVIE